MRCKLGLIPLALFASVVLPALAQAAPDYTLLLDAHPNSAPMELTAWSWGVSDPIWGAGALTVKLAWGTDRPDHPVCTVGTKYTAGTLRGHDRAWVLSDLLVSSCAVEAMSLTYARAKVVRDAPAAVPN